MDTKTIITAAVSGLVVALVLILGMGIGQDGRNGLDGLAGVPGVNLIPTTGEQQAITPTANITLSNTDSGKLYLIATGTTATLPALREGVWFRFMVSGAFTDSNFIIDSAEGDNIEGALIVAGAVVDCAAEDQINFVNDGENLGDFVDVYSDGTSWLIHASGALTAAKLTCTDPS